MKKLILGFAVLAACNDKIEKPNPPPVAKAPASLPAAASMPASMPVKVTTVDSGPRILALAGSVLVDGQPAVIGTPVTKTSTIETGENAWARLTLEPHSVIAVRPSSKFTLGTSERKKWSVQLALGAVWSFLPKGSSYEVVTSNAVAGVRGTTVYVANRKEGLTGICACDGEVEETVSGKSKMVKSKHAHIAVLVGGTGKQAKIGKVPKGMPAPQHDDIEAAEIEKLRATIDR